MEALLMQLAKTPLPTILVIGGLAFFFLAIVGTFGANVTISAPKQRLSGILGALLVVSGIALYVLRLPANQGAAPLSDTPPPATGLHILYQDQEPDTNLHGLRFIQFTARGVHNPPTVHDRVWVEFTMQNMSNTPIRLLGTYVTAYDPAGHNRDFAFAHKNITLQPHDSITTSGNVIVDAPGVWELGPHYAIGVQWDNAQYPGHWKRFSLPVAP
jgi:hypothetical protein